MGNHLNGNGNYLFSHEDLFPQCFAAFSLLRFYCTAACMGIKTGWNGNSTLGNPMVMGMSQKVRNGTGGNGN